MRTTVDLPDALLPRTKAAAALRGVSMQDLIINAVERETQPSQQPAETGQLAFPVHRLKHKKVLDLTAFNFDDLLP